MQITPAALQSTFQGFNTLFKDAFNETPIYYKDFASERTSVGEAENYAFLAKLPKFRRWVGERVWHNLAAHTQKLVNVDWEDGVELERNHLQDDQLGIYTDAIKLLGQQAKQLWDDAVVEALQAGGATVTYDGQFFFDTDHPVDVYDSSKGTQTNKYTAKPLSPANYEDVRQKTMTLKGEDGRPLGLIPNLLLVPPQLEATGRRLVEAEYVAESSAGVTNINRGSAKLLVMPKLANEPTVWYLAVTTLGIKPMIVQIRQAPTFVSLDKATDPNVVNQKKYRYGSDARGAAGYGLWQMITRCEG